MLNAYAARLGFRGPDYLDISLQGNMRRAEKGESGGHRGIGLFFAPSPEILYPYLSARRFSRATEADWQRYVRQYTAQMRRSYQQVRPAWNLLLSWDRVVLLCFCTDPAHCHRTVLGAEILPKLGARFSGEIGAVQSQARA